MDLPIHYLTSKGVTFGMSFEVLHVKASLTRNFPPKFAPKLTVFWRKMGSKCKSLFSVPSNGTSLCKTTSFDVLLFKMGAEGLAVRHQQNPKLIY